MRSEADTFSWSLNTLAPSHRHGCSEDDGRRREVALGPNAAEENEGKGQEGWHGPLRQG